MKKWLKEKLLRIKLRSQSQKEKQKEKKENRNLIMQDENQLGSGSQPIAGHESSVSLEPAHPAQPASQDQPVSPEPAQHPAQPEHPQYLPESKFENFFSRKDMPQEVIIGANDLKRVSIKLIDNRDIDNSIYRGYVYNDPDPNIGKKVIYKVLWDNTGTPGLIPESILKRNGE